MAALVAIFSNTKGNRAANNTPIIAENVEAQAILLYLIFFFLLISPIFSKVTDSVLMTDSPMIYSISLLLLVRG
jgi:hypothetical protein